MAGAMADPIGIAVGVIALVELAVHTTQYVKDVKGGGRERTRLQDELRSVTSILEMLQDRTEDQESADDKNDDGGGALVPAAVASLVGPDGPIERLRETLESIVAKLVPQVGFKKLAQPYKWPFDKKDVLEHLATIERLKSHFLLVLQNDLVALAKLSHEKVVRIGMQVADLDTARRDEEAEKILTWISTMSMPLKQADVLQSAQPGTGKWFLEADTFLDWVHGDSDLLWCPGIPGAGKTRLASLIVDFLEANYTAPKKPLVYVYCDYNQRDSQTSLSLVSSLLEQVLRSTTRSSSLPPVVLSLYTKHSQRGTRPTLKQVSDIFGQVCSGCDVVRVVVDGLDEFAISDDDSMHFINTVRGLGTNVRLLVASRTSTTFDSYFKNAARVDILGQDQDIRLYLESQIRKQSRLERHARADPTLGEDIIKAITDGSRGMFLLAALHLESLSRKLTRRDVRSSLHTLPTTLDATYDQALARMRNQSEEDVELAETVLLWVLCARRPLSVLELQQMYAVRMFMLEDGAASALENDDLPPGDVVTGVCGGLITVHSLSDTVRLTHYTAEDYLLRTHRSSLHRPRFELSKVSLYYLQLPNFRDGPCASDTAMEERLRSFPFLDYAAQYWGSEVKAENSEGYWESIQGLLSDSTAVDVAVQAWSLPKHRHSHWSQEYPRNVPPLVLAANFELPTILERMVTSGGHGIEGKGSDGETPLIRAASLGHTASIQALLRLGSNVTATDVAGETALERATSAGKPETVRALLDGGANANATNGDAGWTVLMSAVASGNAETVRLLAEAGASLTAQTKWGESALSLAALSGQEAIANVLADMGAILPINQAGRRASLYAARKGLVSLVKRLDSFQDADYGAIADLGLQREPAAVGKDLAHIAEEDEETPADGREGKEDGEEQKTEAQDSDLRLTSPLEGIPYQRGFYRKYDRLDKLGEGHFAQVYVCESKTTKVEYAVKVFSVPIDDPDLATDVRSDGVFLGWKGEIRALMSLRHPRILGLIDVLVSDAMDQLCLVLELSTEGELYHYIVRHQKLSQDVSRSIFHQLLAALSYMHKEGWAHRDIKPENILIQGEDLQIKLADFGLSIKLRELPDEVDDTQCGTPSYVAPEILASDRRYSYGVDVWSAGVVLYICLCGFPPFSDELFSRDFPFTLSQQIQSGRFDYPSPYWDDVDDAALVLIDNMLVVDPGLRYTVDQAMEDQWMSMP